MNRTRATFIPRLMAWVLIAAGAGFGAASGETNEASAFRVCFSRSMFADINANDARASVRAWAQTVAQQSGIPTDPNAQIADRLDLLAKALETRAIDAVGVTVPEFAELRRTTVFDPLFCGKISGAPTVQYVLLVATNSAIQSPADLPRRTLNFFQHPRTCLAQLWLDRLLAQQGVPPAEQILDRLITTSKLPQAVLPVFFGKADACLIDRLGFDTMVELNPQLGRKLKVLAQSDPMIPTLFCLRKDYAPPFREQLVQALTHLHETTSGRQVLTVFQLDQLLATSPESLASGLSLLTPAPRPANSPASPEARPSAAADPVPAASAPLP